MRVLVQDCQESLYWKENFNSEDAGDYSLCDYKGKQKPSWADALIAPDGTFYAVGSCGHEHAAEEHGMTKTDVLIREGWIHFSLEHRLLICQLEIDPAFRVTQSQLNVLFDVLDDGETKNVGWAVDDYTTHQLTNLRNYINNPKNVKD